MFQTTLCKSGQALQGLQQLWSRHWSDVCVSRDFGRLTEIGIVSSSREWLFRLTHSVCLSIKVHFQPPLLVWQEPIAQIRQTGLNWQHDFQSLKSSTAIMSQFAYSCLCGTPSLIVTCRAFGISGALFENAACGKWVWFCVMWQGTWEAKWCDHFDHNGGSWKPCFGHVWLLMMLHS